jgi:hypothetical protein
MMVFCSIWKMKGRGRFDSFVQYHYSYSMEGRENKKDLALAV